MKDRLSGEAILEKWRLAVKRKTGLDDGVIGEMADHLRDGAEELQRGGLAEDEAYLIALKRMGSSGEWSHELGNVHGERIYKEFFLPDGGEKSPKEVLPMIGLALLAGLSSLIPGVITGDVNPLESNPAFWTNGAFFFIPPVAILLALKHRPDRGAVIRFLLIGIAAFLAINFYPSQEPGHSRLIMGLHAPLLLWFMLSPFIRGKSEGQSRPEGEVHFLKFTGETFIYTMLILLGGGVLTMVTLGLFQVLDLDLENFTTRIMIPAGTFAAPVVAAWLTEKKRNVIENLTPVLAKLFIPLFLLLLLAFLVTFLRGGRFFLRDREFLILIDVLLMLVVAMAFYEISSRPSREAPGIYDYLNFTLILLVVLIDIIALGNIVLRIGRFGWTVNKTAALGENLILAVNLMGLSFLYIQFLWGRADGDTIVRGQGRYIVIYRIWFALALFLLPPLFSFS